MKRAPRRNPARRPRAAAPAPEPGEFERIRRLISHLPAGQGVLIGPGDDAALLRARAGHDLAVTVDAFVEGVHWKRAWIDDAALGARFAAANLSDLAAMGAEPRWALLAIGARAQGAAEAWERVQRGVAKALAAHGAAIVGGNLSATTGPEWMTLTLVGEVERGAAWTRRGARPGDLVAVTGSPGRAAAGAALLAAGTRSARVGGTRDLIEAWRSPAPRVAFARRLAEGAAVTAAIDLSDGFAADLGHLCEASGVGATISTNEWPEDRALAGAARRLKRPLDTLRFGPSDDYELVLAVDPERRAVCEASARSEGVPFAIVGEFTDAPGVLTLVDARGRRSPLLAGGWDAFAPTARRRR